MDFIHVDKVRIGFACNSSSTHSLVLLPEELSSISDDVPFDWGSYGWSNFTLVSRESKARYIASQLLYPAAGSLGVSAYTIADPDTREPELRRRAFAWVNKVLRDAGVDYVFDPADPAIQYVDHQSVWSWPTEWVGGGINLEWVKALFDHFVDNPRTAVLGGNDNGGTHPIETDYPGMQRFRLSSGWGDHYVARSEPGGAHWTLFSRVNGTKVRVRLDGSLAALDRSHAPELVDVKITDHCPYPGTRGVTCLSCYQASMPAGVHAPLENITAIAEALGKEHVFEVALGGGEPTFHPQLLEIVKAFRDQQIVPNLTTRNWRFVETDDFAEVKDLLGAVAFSVDGAEDVERLRRSSMFAAQSQYVHHPRLSAQVVMGAVSLGELERMIAISRGADDPNRGWLPLTLLGFKNTGRGEGGAPYSTAGWTHVVRRAARWGMSIDTSLARSSHYDIQAMMGSMSLFTVEFSEGAFSMYVNGVNMRMSQSSYEIDGAVPFDADWLNRYQSWTPTGVVPEPQDVVLA